MTVSKEEMFSDPVRYTKEIMADPQLWEEFKKQSPINTDPEARTAKPWDLINPNIERASDQEAEARYEVCKVCPSFVKITKQCKECGCFMRAKVKIKLAKCPLGKW